MSDAAGEAGAPSEAAPDTAETHEIPALLRLFAGPRSPAAIRRFAERVAASPVATRIAHGAFWSLAGTGLARVFTLAASVVTVRILGREVYGQLGVLISTLLTFQAFASLGLAVTATKFVAELRTTDPARAGRILALSSSVSGIAGLVATVLMWTFAPWLAANTLGAPHLTQALRIASLGLVFTTLGGAQTGALAGFEAFRTVTWLNVWTGLLGVPITIAGVWFWGLEGAVWASIVQAFLQWALTHVAVRRLARRHGITIGMRDGWQEQRVLWTFSLPALAQGVMVGPVNWAAAAILVNRPGGFLEMGAYGATNQWYAAVLFLPSALSGPVLPVLAERIGRGDPAGARKVLLAAVAMSAAVVVPIVLAGSLASPWIVRMYGPAFADAWPTLVVVLVTAGIVAVTNPVGAVLAAVNRVWLGFFMNSGWALVFLCATVFLVPYGALGLAVARLVAYIIHSGWTVWYATRFVRAARATVS